MNWNILDKSYDDTYKAIKVIDFVHEQVHEGRAFTVSYKNADGSTISDNGDITFGITIGRRAPHVLWSPAAGGEAEVFLYENAVFTGGTPLSCVNMNRGNNAALYVPTSSFVLAPSITGAGMQLYNYMLPGGTGGGRQGSVAREGMEWVLRPNTLYTLRLYNRSGGAGYMSLAVSFYEYE